MQSVISTETVEFLKDRDGSLVGKVRIYIKIGQRDPLSQTISIDTKDVRVDENGEEFPIFTREQNVQEKTYNYTYSEYDTQKAQLAEFYAQEIADLQLSGSQIDDYLLLKGLLISLTQNPIYGLTGEQYQIEL